MDETQLAEAQNKEYRHGLVSAQIDIDLPLQIRALRKQRGLTQPELAELTGMKQPRFPLMEQPGGAKFTLETLRRLAEAFDVALVVRFAPFSELMDWSEHFNPDSFAVPSFQSEMDNGAFADAGSGLTPSLITWSMASYGGFLPEIRKAMTIRSPEPQVNVNPCSLDNYLRQFTSPRAQEGPAGWISSTESILPRDAVQFNPQKAA